MKVLRLNPCVHIVSGSADVVEFPIQGASVCRRNAQPAPAGGNMRECGHLVLRKHSENHLLAVQIRLPDLPALNVEQSSRRSMQTDTRFSDSTSPLAIKVNIRLQNSIMVECQLTL